MKMVVEKDGDGYLAKVVNRPNLFAFAYTELEAIKELKNVVEMIMEYHLEQANEEMLIKNELDVLQQQYAF